MVILGTILSLARSWYGIKDLRPFGSRSMEDSFPHWKDDEFVIIIIDIVGEGVWWGGVSHVDHYE